MRLFQLLIFIFLSTNLTIGCESKLFSVYKIDVQQGNAIEAKDVNKIELGMNKEQVLFVLGSPLVTDSFHPDRWDYIYDFTPGYGEHERRHLVLYFDGGEVVEIIKDNIIADDVELGEALLSENEEELSTEELQETAEEIEEQKELEEQAENLETISQPGENPNEILEPAL